MDKHIEVHDYIAWTSILRCIYNLQVVYVWTSILELINKHGEIYW